MAEKPKKNNILKVLLIYIIMVIMIFGVIFIGLVIYYLFNPAIQQCETKDCFMVAANECKDVVFTSNELIGKVKYKSEGCVFTKTIVKCNETEIPEIKAMIEGKSFTCKYKIGEFDKRWLSTLIYGINECDGELKETIGKMLLFVEPSGNKA